MKVKFINSNEQKGVKEWQEVSTYRMVLKLPPVLLHFGL